MRKPVKKIRNGCKNSWLFWRRLRIGEFHGKPISNEDLVAQKERPKIWHCKFFPNQWFIVYLISNLQTLTVFHSLIQHHMWVTCWNHHHHDHQSDLSKVGGCSLIPSRKIKERFH
jgi:hypothetical protein